MPIPLQQAILYGPVRSRRFGASLGVNLLPCDEKWCSYSCVYCQYADTSDELIRPPAFPSVAALRHIFAGHAPLSETIDRITIAGNGEPTLHPRFERAVEEILRFRDEKYPTLPVGILTNGSTLRSPGIRAALGWLDECYVKLDAGSDDAFLRVNRPGNRRAWSYLLESLKELRGVTLQSMFITGSVDNTSENDIASWIDQIRRIRPRAVQVYTIDRDPATAGLLPVPGARLAEIAEAVQQIGVPVDLYD